MVDNSATLNDKSDAGRRDDAPPQDVAREVTPPNPKPKNHASRFIFATGARPLDGFTIKRGIGIGGFGQVYYAVSDAGKEVALKHIQRNLDVELRGVGQCLNLKHPNLLALYDIRYDEAGEGWVVMEYITGESLADVIERNPNGMPQDKIAFWLAGIAAGTACLHDHGIVHRDLKPGNIFDDAGIIKVGDYGLSKFISVNRRSAQTESVGTFHYMAPEIGKGLYGREIDVYALGVILFEMLTGDVPFDGESSQEIIMKHLTAEPKLDHIAEPYRTAIEQALEKDPEKRLSSVPEMLAILNVAPATVGASPINIAKPNVANDVPADEIVDAELNEDPPEAETLFIDDTPEPLPKRKREIEFGPVEHHANYTNSIVHNRQRVQQQLESVEPRPLPSEPIARWATIAWRGIGTWFSDPNISALLKALVMVGVLGGGIPLLVWNPRVIFGLMALGVVYGLYYATRVVILSVLAKDKEEADSEDEAVSRAKRWQNRVRGEISERPWQQRTTELLGSLLMSGAIAGVLSVVIMILAGESMGGSVQQWGPQLAWVALLAIGGAWIVLLLTKLWEGRPGDQVLRRIAMLAAGLGLGTLAYGLDAALFVDVGFGKVREANELWPSWHEGDQPALVAYLAYFGGLFAILRWWLQADPLRSTRLSLWAIVLSGLWGFVIPFPQPWGIMLAVAISIAVQLSAPWITQAIETACGNNIEFRTRERKEEAMTMFVFTLIVIAMLAVVAAVRIRFVKKQNQLQKAMVRVSVVLAVIAIGPMAMAQPGDMWSFEEQLLERYTDLDMLMAVAPAEQAVEWEEAVDAKQVADAIDQLSQPNLEAYDIADGANFCAGSHAVFATLIAAEATRPDWVEQPLFNKGSGDHWVSVSSGPWLTDIEAATALDKEIYEAVVAYVDDQIGRRGAAHRIGLTMNEIQSQLVIVEQYNEEHQSSFGPMQMHHVKLVFTPQYRAEISERWKQHLITARLFKTSIGIGAVMGLMFIAFGVLKRLGGAAR